MLNTLKTVVTGLFNEQCDKQDPLSSFKLTRGDLILLRSQIKLLSDTRRVAKQQSKSLSRMCNKHADYLRKRRAAGHYDDWTIVWKTGMAASTIRHSERYEVRHRHVAYCLLRGKKYNDIEKCSKENCIDVDYLHKIMLPYIPYQLSRLFTVEYLGTIINDNGNCIK